jgi:hypothetical protein
VSFLGEKLRIESLQEAGENISAFADNLRTATDEKLAQFVTGMVEGQREMMAKFAQVLFPPEAAGAAADGGDGRDPEFVSALPGVSDEALAIFQELQDERKAIEEETEQRRNEIVADAGEERARLEAQIAQAQIAFIRSESRIEADYYSNRLARAQSFGAAIQRAEEDHQRNMRRMREDSEMRQAELIGARDAFGLVRERRRAEIERQRAEEDNNVKLSRQNAAFAAEMVQMETQFRLQKARRAEDFALRQATLEEELALVNVRRDEELAILDETTKTALDDLRNAALQRIAVIDSVLVSGLGVVTQAAITSGPAILGEEGREFVLDHATTQAAERMVGGRLTQRNVLGAGGRGGGKNLTLSQIFTFHGDMSPEMRQWYRKTAKAEAVEAFAEVTGV